MDMECIAVARASHHKTDVDVSLLRQSADITTMVPAPTAVVILPQCKLLQTNKPGATVRVNARESIN
jgi:hypothetical protein